MSEPDKGPLPPQPIDELQAIRMLADMVGDLAYYCHQQIGAVQSGRIQVAANVIAEWAVGLAKERE